MVRFVVVGFILALVEGIGGGLEAQVVDGRVIDARSNEPVAMARITLRTVDGERVATELTDAEGWFLLRARSPGRFFLEADRLGYGLQRTEPFEVRPDAPARHDISLAPRAVELEEIVVRGYPGELMHEATLSGVYARRARSPSIGGNRVLVRGDPEFDRQFNVRDILRRRMLPRRTCPNVNEDGERIPFVFFDGREASRMGPRGTDFVLDLPIRELEAVEFYRDEASAPMTLYPEVEHRMEGRRVYRNPVRLCGLVAVWSRGAPR